MAYYHEPALAPLSLEIPKNKSQEHPTSCPNSSLAVDFILHRETGDVRLHKRVRCKRWDCEFCGRINALVLRRRLRQGFKGLLTAHGIDRGQFGYRVKLFTLTCPGKEWRAKVSPAAAEVEIKYALGKLLNLIRHHYPLSHSVWVRELQQDGYPHIHLILMGDKIAPRGILDFVRKNWSHRYGLGNVDVRFVEDEKRLVNYVTKYITKEMGGKGATGDLEIPVAPFPGPRPRWYHVFGMSQLLRMLCNTEKPEITVLRIYKINYDDTGEPLLEMIWERDTFESGAAQEEVKRNLQELLDFFDKAPYVGEQTHLL